MVNYIQTAPNKKDEKNPFESMKERFQEVISFVEKYNVSNRIGAYILGVDRVAKIARVCGIYG